MDAETIILEGACFFCGVKTSGPWCECCEQDFIINIVRCPVCARRTTKIKACGQCLSNKPNYTNTEVLFDYNYPGDLLIKAFKFNNRPELARCLADRLVDKLRPLVPMPDVLIPVPLHTQRQQERGYNQSLELARRIGKLLAITVNSAWCRRIINTERQSALPMKTRKKNVKGAFKLSCVSPYKHAVIIDDVITTGSTVNEIASLLKKSGCRRVDIWAIAKT
jgi:ComF family protein